MLMLSSTDVVSKCRLLVDQAPILSSMAGGAVDAARIPQVAVGTGGPGEFLRRGRRTPVDARLPRTPGVRRIQIATAECLASLDWSTAAMLSARFAIVTPTGGLPAEAPCDECNWGAVRRRRLRRTHLARRLADTAPSAHGEDRGAERRTGIRTTVAPPGAPVPAEHPGVRPRGRRQRAPSPSPSCPITGGAAKGHLTAEDAWIQRITLAMPEACPDGEAADECRDALNELIRRRRDPSRRHRRDRARVDAGRRAAARLGALGDEPGAVHHRDAGGCGLRGESGAASRSRAHPPATPATTVSPNSRMSSASIRAGAWPPRRTRGPRRAELDPQPAVPRPARRTHGARNATSAARRHAIRVRVTLTVS